MWKYIVNLVRVGKGKETDIKRVVYFRIGPANYAVYNNKQGVTSSVSSGTFRSHVAHWSSPLSVHLAQMGMQDYENLFLMAGIETVEGLTRLTNQDLKVIGITSSKHRKRIMQSYASIKSQLECSANFDNSFYPGYSTTSNKTAAWKQHQLSPGPRDQLMSQYV